MSTIESESLIFKQYGNPNDVVVLEKISVPLPDEDEVLLEVLIAPVNPVDINIIQGLYAFKLPLPAVPGMEGVARVIQVGQNVRTLNVGDHVIPLEYIGSWRRHLVTSEERLMKIPLDLGLVDAAMLQINPPTVYRMLRDYENLEKGDTVIQNGANSSCGQIVIQMCRIWGINTVNIVRNRPEINDLKSYLKNLGATYVLTEEEARTTDIFSSGKLPRPTLALNCVGGDSAVTLMKHLDSCGTMVTYGGMSRKLITVTTSSLIFKQLKLVGFSINTWMRKEETEERVKMFNELFQMITRGELKAPSWTLVKLTDYKSALRNTLTKDGKTGKKYLIEFNTTGNKL